MNSLSVVVQKSCPLQPRAGIVCCRRALSPYLPGTTLAGSARIDARVLLADGSWRLDGGVRVERARLSLDALIFAIGDLTGALRFEGDRVELSATGAAGDGVKA